MSNMLIVIAINNSKVSRAAQKYFSELNLQVFFTLLKSLGWTNKHSIKASKKTLKQEVVGALFSLRASTTNLLEVNFLKKLNYHRGNVC